MSLPTFQHNTPAFRTFSGAEALASLPRELERVGCRRAVVVCGQSMVRHPGALAKVESALGERFAGRFSEVLEHSPVDVVRAARDALVEFDADSVIAVGGGSAIVTARAASILLAEGDDVPALATRRADDGRMVSPRLSAMKLPQWVVPSTPTTAYAKAGSAVRDRESGDRWALFDPKTRAQGVFFDPDVATTAPPSLARAAALNAFSMAVDGLQAESDDVLARALLLEALSVLVQWLPELERRPDDAAVRLHLMAGALLCGQGSDFVGGGLAQSLAHAAGPRSAVANGIVEALLLPHTMRFNAPVTAARLGSVAAAFDIDRTRRSSEAAISAVESFLGGLEMPRTLRDSGIDRSSLDEIVDHALRDWSTTRVPRPADREDLTALLEAAW